MLRLLYFITCWLLCLAHTTGQDTSLPLTGRYLHLPVAESGTPTKMSVRIGETLRAFDVILPAGEPDFYAFMDVREFAGQTATISLPAPHPALALIHSSDAIVGADSLYREARRPQLHFSSRRGWLNDPNGLVWHDGRYHLYYQHNPYGWPWGNMHWGHASSPDLLHWTEHPVAIYPPRYGDNAFSGSAVIDEHNTSGLGRDGIAPLVAIYTSTDRGECLKYSLDGGMTFEEYAGNPVVEHQGRDPKVFWYAPQQKWVMVVYDERPRRRELAIYDSPDLKEWTYRSSHGPFWECPELFPLPVDGDTTNVKWVMYSGNAQYFIGTFDGFRFTPETPRYRFRRGAMYASQTYNNTPDGRRIQVGWGSGLSTPGMPFNQMMTLPTELRLETTVDGVRLRAAPIRELAGLHRDAFALTDRVASKSDTVRIEAGSDLLHVRLTLDVGDAWETIVHVDGYELVYQTTSFLLDGHFVRPTADGKLHLEIITDRTSAEVFANGGELYSVEAHTPAGDGEVYVTTRNPGWQTPSGVRVDTLRVWTLNSVWE